MKFFVSLVMVAMVWTGVAKAEVSPHTVDGATTVTAEQAADLFDAGVVFVDVRKPSDFEAGRIPGAIHLDLESDFSEASLSEHIGKADKVVIYCNGESCLRSSEACGQAVDWGFSEVYYFRDGYPAWEAAGLPVE